MSRLYGSLILATLRANAFASRLLAVSALWIAHLSYAKSQRFRFAAFGCLALYGSLDMPKLSPRIHVKFE